MKYTSQKPDYKPRYVTPGSYLITVVEATETVSKAGSDMIKLYLEVEGHGVFLYDYLISTESCLWKVDAFRRATGEDVVENEEVELYASQLEGLQGWAHLRVEEYEGKKHNKVATWLEEGPKNRAARKPAPKKAVAPAATATPKAEENDHEPF